MRKLDENSMIVWLLQVVHYHYHIVYFEIEPFKKKSYYAKSQQEMTRQSFLDLNYKHTYGEQSFLISFLFFGRNLFLFQIINEY